jgi:hypothetical protein
MACAVCRGGQNVGITGMFFRSCLKIFNSGIHFVVAISLLSCSSSRKKKNNQKKKKKKCLLMSAVVREWREKCLVKNGG